MDLLYYSEGRSFKIELLIEAKTAPIFHSCIIDGLFDEDGTFYPASFSKEGVQSIQEKIRTRVLWLFQRREQKTVSENSRHSSRGD